VSGLARRVAIIGGMTGRVFLCRFEDFVSVVVSILWLSMLSLESRHLMKKTKNSENRLHTMSMEQRSLGFSH
jgi:hypothetical protein